MRDTDDLLRRETSSLKGVYKGLCVPDQAFVTPVHTQRRGENAMTTTFELVCQKLPTFGPLAATMDEKVRDHCNTPSI